MSPTEQTKSRTLLLDEGDLRAQLSEVRAQIARYRIREDQLLRALELFDTDASAIWDEPEGRGDDRPASVRSQRDVIVDLLKGATEPLSVSQITASVAAAMGHPVSRTSISPALAKLKQAGLVAHDTDGWSWRE